MLDIEGLCLILFRFLSNKEYIQKLQLHRIKSCLIHPNADLSGEKLTCRTWLRPEVKLLNFTSSDINTETACSKGWIDFLLLVKEARREWGKEKGRKEKERETRREIRLLTKTRGKCEHWQVKEEVVFCHWGLISLRNNRTRFNCRMLTIKLAFPFPLWIRERPEAFKLLFLPCGHS